jgi:hypothetical protein
MNSTASPKVLATKSKVQTQYSSSKNNKSHRDAHARMAASASPFAPTKKKKERTRLTVGGNLIHNPGDVSTKTAGLTTAKILFNSTISTPGAKFMCMDVKNFYLNTPMDRFEYMRLPLNLLPDEIIKQYDLQTIATDGWVYVEIRKGMYGLPQAGLLANQLLQKRLATHGYAPVTHTHGLWRHKTRPITFSLVVDDFGVKYVGKHNANHLLTAL